MALALPLDNTPLILQLEKKGFDYSNWTDLIPVAMKWVECQQLEGPLKKVIVVESMLTILHRIQLPDSVSRETFTAISVPIMEQMIETILHETPTLQNDRVIITPKTIQSIDDSIVVDRIVQNVMRVVESKELKIDLSSWVTLLPLTMHAVAALTAPDTTGTRKREIALQAVRSVVKQLHNLDGNTRQTILTAVDQFGPSAITTLKTAADGVFQFARDNGLCRCCRVS